jgi:hypothetical protein
MIKIKIGADERMLGDVDNSWVNQQINQRRADGQSVCVRVTIQERDIDLVLTTPTCPSYAGSPRKLSAQEEKVCDLWEQRGLRKPTFTGGNLIAFLNQLKQL